MRNTTKTLQIIEELSKINLFDIVRRDELLAELKVSSKTDAQNYIDNHKHSNYLQDHYFTAEEDANDKLTIRPLRIMLNYFNRFDGCADSKAFVDSHVDEIYEILTAIEIPQDEIEEAFNNFTGLLHDVNAVNAINILDDK